MPGSTHYHGCGTLRYRCPWSPCWRRRGAGLAEWLSPTAGWFRILGPLPHLQFLPRVPRSLCTLDSSALLQEPLLWYVQCVPPHTPPPHGGPIDHPGTSLPGTKPFPMLLTIHKESDVGMGRVHLTDIMNFGTCFQTMVFGLCFGHRSFHWLPPSFLQYICFFPPSFLFFFF